MAHAMADEVCQWDKLRKSGGELSRDQVRRSEGSDQQLQLVFLFMKADDSVFCEEAQQSLEKRPKLRQNAKSRPGVILTDATTWDRVNPRREILPD